MAYTIDDFPFETNNPQIEVALPVGTHVLELVVEDSAGLRSLPDTVVITVEREDVPDAEITAIEPVSGLQGSTFNASIRGTGFAEATAVTFYTQTRITRPVITTSPILPTIVTRPTNLSIPIISPIGPFVPINIPDNSITAEITARTATGIKFQIAVSRTASPGTRTFSVTTPQGVIYSKTLTFTVRGIITPTITIPTVTIPTLTIPTIPTLTIPTLTIPTVTRPTLTIPTVTIPTITRPTVILPTGVTPIIREGLDLTSVRGVGAATVDKLTAAGIASVDALAAADAKKVATILGYQDITRAQTLINEAARLIG